jgi:ubiquinone biosynthesis protein
MNMTDAARRRFPLRHIPRLMRIAGVAARHGWGHYVQHLKLPRHLTAAEPSSADTARATDGARLRSALEELGPTFVKFGQLLSTQRDLFPNDVIDELQMLQERVPPFPDEQAMQIVEQELGGSIDSNFSSFEHAPFAAASIAQVHRATSLEGEHLVVKVQRPGISRVIEEDVAILFYVARMLERHIPATHRLNLTGLVEEFAENIARELDFMREAQSAERFLAQLAGERAVYVPRILWPLSTQRVLCMEHSPGVRIDADHPASPEERVRLGDTLMRLLLVQLFEHGFFHGDPHPGNIFLLEDGRICYHDFGIIGRLSPRDQENLRQLFLAVIARDPEWLADTYLEMGGAIGAIDRAAFTHDVGHALEHYYAAYGRGSSFAEILGAFIKLGGKHNVRLLRQILLAAKAFMLTESLVRSLDPQFDSVAAFQRYSTRLMQKQITPDLSREGLARGYRAFGVLRSSLLEAPLALAKGLKQLQAGELVLRVRHEALESLQQHLDRAGNRLSFSLIIASIVIASSIVMSYHTGPHLEGIPLLGLAGYGIAALLGLWWAVAILRSGRL